MRYIGFSTGCLYRRGLQLEEVMGKYLEAGANAVELSYATPNKLLDFEIADGFLSIAQQFTFLTLHAPWKAIRYGADLETERLLDKLHEFSERLPIKGIVLHPDLVDNFALLEKSALPFMIENMDRRKSFGIYPEHIEQLKRDYSFGFVFDVKHAYEHDPSLELGKRMISIMGDRLHHFHISGSAEGEIHWLVSRAENREAIEKILEIKHPAPIILEGIATEDIALREEVAYINKFLGTG